MKLIRFKITKQIFFIQLYYYEKNNKYDIYIYISFIFHIYIYIYMSEMKEHRNLPFETLGRPLSTVI